jgi:hypothetical protein
MTKHLIIPATIIGAITGLGSGYAVFALSRGRFYVSFGDWLTGTGNAPGHTDQDALLWLAGGIALMNAVTYLLKR